MREKLYYKVFMRIKVFFFATLKRITRRKIIVDVTGTILTPGNHGEKCRGNGMHLNWSGRTITCCCDECDYMMCCFEESHANICADCDNRPCPFSGK